MLNICPVRLNMPFSRKNKDPDVECGWFRQFFAGQKKHERQSSILFAHVMMLRWQSKLGFAASAFNFVKKKYQPI